MNRVVVGALAGLVSLAPALATATEGASGRPVAGTGVAPAAGVVPAEPVWILGVGLQYVDGKLGGARTIPVAGRIAAEAENRYTLESFTLLRVWDTGKGAWNFASAVTLPFMQNDVSVSTYVPPVAGLSLSGRVSGPFDIAITPIVAGYHFSASEHGSLGLRIWAPTGRYESGRLANLGQNVWTFVPTAAYTRFFANGIELSASTSLNFSTTNDATGYRNAPLWTLDVLASKRLGDGFGAGAIVGWVEQLGRDRGPLADQLNGFRGSEVALGPIVTYATKIGALPVSTSLRWVKTVAAHNRFERDTVLFAVSMPVGF